MNIHEYQAKDIFRKHDIAVPQGYLLTDVGDVETKAASLGAFPVVVKAHIVVSLGHDSTGGSLSLTVIVKLHCAAFPAASVIAYCA